MNKTIKLQSPAKINLRLDVLGKRADGYHEIESIMTRVSLFDEITLSVSEGSGIEVVCGEGAPSGEDNIAYKAARAILEKSKARRHKVRIEINKKIPVAAGLGGGSSNAASVLAGLNEMLGLGLTREELMVMGKRIGADVPFFLFEKAAIARGIGEILEPIELPGIWLLLVNPNIPVSTADVYRGLSLKIGLTKQGFDNNMLHFQKNAEGIVSLLHNDLEVPAFRIEPEIARVKEAVASTGALGVLMSGSGATVFGVFGSEEAALQAESALSGRHREWRVFVTENI